VLDEVASMFSSAKILEFLAPGDIVSQPSLHRNQLKVNFRQKQKKKNKKWSYLSIGCHLKRILKNLTREHSLEIS
jgi:hypothetical protein